MLNTEKEFSNKSINLDYSYRMFLLVP